METWKPIVGYEGLYEASDLGRIRRIAPWSDGRKTKPAETMTGKIAKNGYHRVSLRKSGQIKEHAVHRLVAATFLGEIPSTLHQVNHLNGNKRDNRPCNLEYVTPSENQYHSYRVLKSPTRPGSKHHNAKITEGDVIEMRRLRRSGSMVRDIAILFNISQPQASDILNWKAWKHVTTPAEEPDPHHPGYPARFSAPYPLKK